MAAPKTRNDPSNMATMEPTRLAHIERCTLPPVDSNSPNELVDSSKEVSPPSPIEISDPNLSCTVTPIAHHDLVKSSLTNDCVVGVDKSNFLSGGSIIEQEVLNKSDHDNVGGVMPTFCTNVLWNFFKLAFEKNVLVNWKGVRFKTNGYCNYQKC